MASRLRKELGLFDVYVLSTGAMISSGIFLLPGIAVSLAGPSAVLAYLLAGVMIVPAMLSKAELATAMPKAGGTYYFLDRTLGPLVGTVGGVGTWLALILKSAFALIGMGAYLALVVDLPIVPAALGFTVLFTLLNIAGAKESSSLLRLLVGSLIGILVFFIASGLFDVAAQSGLLRDRFSPFFEDGYDGVLAAVGLQFISYIGLTKVASLAEEVRDPDRNIPLGMTLALVTVTAIYVLGVFIMIAVLGPDVLGRSLTPAADAAATFDALVPGRFARWLMVAAAIAAFAAMANAGIMAASRYPLAMARDRLFPDRFQKTGSRGTPVLSILLTTAILALMLVSLDVMEVAELAAALQLLVFGLVNVAVIVMRESRIESYDPGFRSPLYPWMQLLGIFVTLVLVAEMGWMPVLFTVGVTAACFGWYTYWARSRIVRDGAIFHVFERLGRRRFQGLDRELRDIMKEKGARDEDPFDEVVAHAPVIDVRESVSLTQLIADAAAALAVRLPITSDQLETAFVGAIHGGATPIARGAALVHTRLPVFEGSELLICRCVGGVRLDLPGVAVEGDDTRPPVRAVFFLVSDENAPGRHLRILAQLAGRVEEDSFMDQWLASSHEQELKEVLLRDDHFFSVQLLADSPTAALIGLEIREVALPGNSLVALIRRGEDQIVPRGGTRLERGDRLTFIGDIAGIRALQARYGGQTVA